MLPLQPRAHSPADNKIFVRGRDASSYYNPVYYGDANQRIAINSGDSSAFSTPASNPRIDVVYITPSGDIRIQQGSEAASPSIPSLSPSGDTRFPVCAVYNKPTQTKIVNFEDKDSNTGDGYIYRDLRPFLVQPSIGGAGSLTSSIPLSVTGDNAVGTATTASRADHTHAGVHTAKVVGSGDIFGDIGFEGNVQQQGQRLKIVNTGYSEKTVKLETDESFTSTSYVNSSLVLGWNQARDGIAFFNFSGTTEGIGNIISAFAINVDGEIIHEASTREGTGNSDFPTTLSGSKFLRSGNHTLTLQYKIASSTGSILGTSTPARLRVQYPN